MKLRQLLPLAKALLILNLKALSRNLNVGFEILTVVIMKVSVFWRLYGISSQKIDSS
jgi:hypothetical protein